MALHPVSEHTAWAVLQCRSEAKESVMIIHDSRASVHACLKARGSRSEADSKKHSQQRNKTVINPNILHVNGRLVSLVSGAQAGLRVTDCRDRAGYCITEGASIQPAVRTALVISPCVSRCPAI
jgi:hypothetical protein